MTPHSKRRLQVILRDLECLWNLRKQEWQPWEQHALRGAYYAVDAVYRQEIESVPRAQAQVAQSQFTIENAASILYGGLPLKRRNDEL